MKTYYIYVIIALLSITSCKQHDNRTQEKVSFEIYETLMRNEVPKSMIDQLNQMNVQLNADTQSPIIAFLPVDSTIQLSKITNDKVDFLQTAQPVDKDKKYFAIVAVKKQSYITTTDLKKTKPNKNSVEIYFNLQGINKWSDLTKNNIGKLIAFSIDEKVYTLTLVSGEIKNGIAIIDGLENNDLATKISKLLNASL